MERRPALSCRHWLLLGTIAATVLPAIGCASALFSAMYLIKGTDVDADFDGLKQKKVAVVCRPLVGLTYQNSGVAKDLAKQPAASGQSQPSGGGDTMTTDANAEDASGGSNPTGEGFVGSQGKDSSDYLQEKAKTDGDIEETSDQPPLDGE